MPPELFETDEVSGLTLVGNGIYWHTNCGELYSPPRSRLRSKPAAGGLTTTHYFPVDCQPDRVASANVAVDDSHMYWLTGDGRVVRLSRTATQGQVPELLSETELRSQFGPGVVIGGFPSCCSIAIDATSVYWSEDGKIFSAPKGGGARTLYDQPQGPGAIRELKVGPDRSLYFLIGQSLRRIRESPSRATDVIASNVTAYALTRERVYWAQPNLAEPRRTVGINSRRLSDLGDIRPHYFTDGRVDPRIRPVIGSLTVDEYQNIYWHEYRNEHGGPIYRLSPGQSAEAITDYIQDYTIASPPGSGSFLTMPIQLVTDGQYLLWTNYWSISRLAVNATPDAGPGDVWIMTPGIEVTQGIQTLDHRIPLIEYKRTFVRVYVQSLEDSRGPWTNVTVQLRVGGGQLHAPIGGTANSWITVSPTGSDRRSLMGSFLFALYPEETIAGERELEVRIIPPLGRPESDVDNNVQRIRVRFNPAVPRRFTIYGARYRYRNVDAAAQMRYGLSSPNWPERPFSDFEPHRAGAENILPLAELGLIRPPNDPVETFDYSEGGGYDTARVWYARLLDMLHPEGGAYIAILQPETGNKGFASNTPNGRNRWLNFQSDTSSPGITLAHEIGHWFARPHTWDDPEFPRRATPGFTVRRADGSYEPGRGPWDDPAPDIGDLVGIQTYPNLQLVAGRNLDGSVNFWDLMSYKMPQWISAFTYCKILVSISGGRSRCTDRIEGGG